MYKKARTMVKAKHGNSEEFEMKLGLLYADDLVLKAESIEERKENVLRWKECMEVKGLKVNIGKTKVMVSGMNCGAIEKMGKWPCTVCMKRVLGITRCDIRDVVDGSTSGAQM